MKHCGLLMRKAPAVMQVLQVYDVTAYIDDHPGGSETILLNAGVDCTEEFMGVHSQVSTGRGPAAGLCRGTKPSKESLPSPVKQQLCVVCGLVSVRAAPAGNDTPALTCQATFMPCANPALRRGLNIQLHMPSRISLCDQALWALWSAAACICTCFWLHLSPCAWWASFRSSWAC